MTTGVVAGPSARGLSPEAKARSKREKKTIAAMVRLYCRSNHATRETLCEDCGAVLTYALKRIDECPFIDDKPTCLACTVHCYESGRREQIKAIMRFSGPRMIYRHPVLSIRHILDGRARS